jgi:Signal transduction histidine kinase
LINLTKLNHTDLKKEKIDFVKLVDECIESSRSLPHFNAITFTKDIQNNIEFHSEWTLLNAIIQNLIENAVKYSGPVSPFVKITVRCQGAWITIDVQDNGQGIPDEHQSKIFEMFYRATQNSNGTGLGLYILKRSVDRLKGTIEMKSKLGTGSVFTVKLPSMMGDTPVTH